MKRSMNRPLAIVGVICAATMAVGTAWFALQSPAPVLNATEAVAQACETLAESEYDEVQTSTLQDAGDLPADSAVTISNYRFSGGGMHEKTVVYNPNGMTAMLRIERIVKDRVEYVRGSRGLGTDDIDTFTGWYVLHPDRYPLAPLPCFGAADAQEGAGATGPGERHFVVSTESRPLFGGGEETTKRELWIDANGRPVRGLVTVSRTSSDDTTPRETQRIESTYSGFGERNVIAAPTVTPGPLPTIVPTATPTPTPTPPCSLAVPNHANDPALMRDCVALLAAKDTLRGTATLNWSANTTIAQWDGVTVGGTPKRVTKLLLANKSLSGTIPWALERLDKLAELRLSGNALTGCIPLALKSVATHDLASLGLSYCGVRFGASTYDAPEGAITSVTLQLGRALERSVSVPITTTDVTAESTDYLISGVSGGAVTIPAGSASATFGVNAHRDSDCLDETLQLGFGTLSGLASGTPSTTTVTIKDDDACPSVLFDAASHTVFEGTSHVFQVRLSTSGNQRHSVPVTVTNGTAESGDYTVTGLTNGAVEFPGGRTYVRLTIAANQDADCDDETVTLGLGTLTDGLTAGTPSTLTVTLDDDDGGPGCSPVKFSALAYSATEGSTATVTVQLGRALASSVTVPVSVSAGTAESGDYAVSGLPSGGLAFAAGEMSKTFTITAAQDADCADETVELAFGTLPAGVSRGLNPSATLTLRDDDTSCG